jgi:hypothetical protein
MWKFQNKNRILQCLKNLEGLKKRKMNSDSKNIKSSLRPEIERVKGFIRDAVRPFDGSGYVFKTALSEIRKEGTHILFVREKCHYIKI